MAVPIKVHLEQSNTLPQEKRLFRAVWREGFNWDGLQRFIAEYRPPTRLVRSRQNLRTIDGYSDSFGTDSFNLDLSQRRADAGLSS